MATNVLTRFLDEVGIRTLFKAPLDTKLLCLQRFVRLFAYGSSTLILAAYLKETGVSETKTGLFMTLTLFGDVVMGLMLTLIADKIGRRAILGVGSALMAMSGIVFALTDNYYALLIAAIFGVVTPSGNEVGPFRAIEESVIAHLTDSKDRPSIFAWYTLTGTIGTALGLITCGWVTTVLQRHGGWSTIDTYHLVFVGYAAIGLIKLVLSLLLSQKCELEKQPPPTENGETAPLLVNGSGTKKQSKSKSLLSLLPSLSTESLIILVQLCALFAIDNFASGLAPMSWVTYYFRRRFDLDEGSIGTLFFVTSIISAISILVAASIAKRIGNVKTMVFTHLPSAIFLALIGIPSQLPLAMMFVILRACTQSMDSAPRSAFISAIVLPNERTAVMGMVNVVKTIAQSLGPLITGILVDRSLFWVAFLAAGALKASYDVGLLSLFLGYRSREERVAEEHAAAARDRGHEEGE